MTQPLSGIKYRPTYTYYHSHYHYHCHDQYHMMLISLSFSVSLSIYQNHFISRHFTLCRIMLHHTKIIYFTFTHINVYIYIYIYIYTCDHVFIWQFSPVYYAQLVPAGCRRAGACPSRPWGRAMASLRCNGLVCAKICRNLFMYNHTNIYIYMNLCGGENNDIL